MRGDDERDAARRLADAIERDLPPPGEWKQRHAELHKSERLVRDPVGLNWPKIIVYVILLCVWAAIFGVIFRK